eukprot:1146844-Pelagomonas_calceolata.AAC.2
MVLVSIQLVRLSHAVCYAGPLWRACCCVTHGVSREKREKMQLWLDRENLEPGRGPNGLLEPLKRQQLLPEGGQDGMVTSKVASSLFASARPTQRHPPAFHVVGRRKGDLGDAERGCGYGTTCAEGLLFEWEPAWW